LYQESVIVGGKITHLVDIGSDGPLRDRGDRRDRQPDAVRRRSSYLLVIGEREALAWLCVPGSTAVGAVPIPAAWRG